MSRDDGGSILRVNAALQQRFEEVTDETDGGNSEAERNPRRQSELRQPPISDDRETERGTDKAADRTLDGFLRPHDRCGQTRCERSAAVVLDRVADGNGQNQEQRRFPAE